MISIRNRVTQVINGNEEPGLLFVPLFICEKLYTAGVMLKNFLYEAGLLQSKKAGCNIICVGAITVGGAGKTPFVELLAKKLANKKVGILSRGYGGKSGLKVHTVSDGTNLAPPPPISADEPYMLARKLDGIPVVCAPKRIDGARELVEKFGIKIIVMDDGFGHRAIKRDLNLLLVSAIKPFGNKKLLPAGPLREPPQEVNRADIIVISGQADVSDEQFRETENLLLRYTDNKKSVIFAKGAITGFVDASGSPHPAPEVPVFIFSGVARPERFLQSLKALGVDVADKLNFDDHHHYTTMDIQKISDTAKNAGAEFIVTTEKDSARLANHLQDFKFPFLTATYEVTITKGEEILDKALGLLHPSTSLPT